MNKKVIICLDIDDCIWPSDQTWLGKVNDTIDILKINLNRIQLIINKYNAEIFLISSWSNILEIKDKSLFYNKEYSYRETEKTKKFYMQEKLVLQEIKNFLDGYFIGLSCGNRFSDINELLKNKENKIISIDDMDLSEIKNQNHLFIQSFGFINNLNLYEIKNFIED